MKSIIKKPLGNSAKLRRVTANQGKPHSHGISLKLGHALKDTKQLNFTVLVNRDWKQNEMYCLFINRFNGERYVACDSITET